MRGNPQLLKPLFPAARFSPGFRLALCRAAGAGRLGRCHLRRGFGIIPRRLLARPRVRVRQGVGGSAPDQRRNVARAIAQRCRADRSRVLGD